MSQNIQHFAIPPLASTADGDDYAAMREVLTRRYDKMQEAEANGETVKWPDAVIDGGKGQIGVAVSVWEELGLHIPLVSRQRPGAQSRYGEAHAPLGEVFRLPPHSPPLHASANRARRITPLCRTGHRKNATKHALPRPSATSPAWAANAAKPYSPASAACAA